MSIRTMFSLSFALALVYFISFPARAEFLKNFKADGSFETRSFSIDNAIDRNSVTDDHRGETNTRLMVGANFDLLDDVHSRFLLARSPRFGTGAPSVTSVEDSLLFQNAYVKIDKVFGHVDLTIGKQFYGDSNDLNIYFGPQNDDLLSITSVDLFRTDVDLGGIARFQGIAGTTADAATGTRGTNTDANVWGGELNTDKIVPLANTAVYYYTAQTHAQKTAVATGNNTLSVGGARLGGTIPLPLLGGFGYNAEYLQNFGRNNTVAGAPAYHGNAYFLGLKFGQDVAAGYPIRAKLEYGRGSRDFVAIAPGRRFGIIWGEHSNGFGAVAPAGTVGAVAPSLENGRSGPGLTNLKVVDAGIGTTIPGARLGFDLNWYRFLYDANLNGLGVSAGTEYDFIVSYKHSENVSFEANAATFQVGTSLQNAAPVGTNPITRLGADVKIKY